MQFFPERVVEILKKRALPRQAKFKCPSPAAIRLLRFLGWDQISWA